MNSAGPERKRGRLSAKGASAVATGVLGIAFVVCIWQLGAVRVGSPLILPSPKEALSALYGLMRAPAFPGAVAGSLARVAIAFAVSCAAGSITGIAAGLSRFAKSFSAPVLTTIRATPVLALVLVAMFWFPSGTVPVFVAILMSLPVAHSSAEAGMAAADPGLLQMARLFGVPRRVRLTRLRIPAASLHFAAGAKSVLGLCWKVVVAGEVLSQPRFALGTGLQDARLSLETPSVFAWAAVTVILCGTSEFVLGRIVRHIAARNGSPA